MDTPVGIGFPKAREIAKARKGLYAAMNAVDGASIAVRHQLARRASADEVVVDRVLKGAESVDGMFEFPRVADAEAWRLHLFAREALGCARNIEKMANELQEGLVALAWVQDV